MEVDHFSPRGNSPTPQKSKSKKLGSQRLHVVKRRVIDDDDSMDEDGVKSEDVVKLESSDPSKLFRRNDMNDVFSDGGGSSDDEKPQLTSKPIHQVLPSATDDAKKAFKEISDNIYQRKDLGLNPHLDEGSMTCECTYDPATDPREFACGEDCVNRQIFVECTPGECRCGSYCLNRRFQRKQYAPVQVIKTENKGYGLQALETLEKGRFVYEYVGEVIDEPSFIQRMQKYSDNGIIHFYFMMLQKNEFIDATIKGGLGRFINHSCNANCEVGKWVVGKHFRMGIFTKRKIREGEELTFNYNVDRYGADAQKCYCGEPNCSGYIGGNTQTELDTLPEMGLEALGMDSRSLASARRRKPKKGDAILPDPTPMRDNRDVAKVVTAIRTFKDDPELIKRLIKRIQMTEEPSLQRQVLRLHGLSVFAVIVQDLKDEAEVITLALDVLLNLPLLKRNKIEDSKIEHPISQLKKSESKEIQSLSTMLLAKWEPLEKSYRIPKKQISLDADSEGNFDETGKKRVADDGDDSVKSAEKRLKLNSSTNPSSINTLEIQVNGTTPVEIAVWGKKRLSPPPRRPPPRRSPPPQQVPSPATVDEAAVTKAKLQAIIEEAQRKAAEAQAAKDAALREERLKKAKIEKARESHKKKKLSAKKKSSKGKDKESSSGNVSKATLSSEEREKKLTHLVSEVVIKSMSHYKDRLEKEQFKKRAKELTHILVQKELKSESNASKVSDFSDDKKKKMKKFIKEYVDKLLKRIKEKQSGGGDSPMTPGLGYPLDLDSKHFDERKEVEI